MRQYVQRAIHAAQRIVRRGARKLNVRLLTDKEAPSRKNNPTPTFADVPYGPHPRQVLDFWKAESHKPTPLVFWIHGGGWQSGGKHHIADVAEYLAAGISVVAIEYRFIADAIKQNVMPPVKMPLLDAARALQFVRSKAPEWNIDRDRIGGFGGSAGACTGLWLAFHADLADSNSRDPIARESTRLWCFAGRNAQTTLDPQEMREWTPNSKYGGHAFGIKGDKNKNVTAFERFLASRDAILPWISEYSPYALVGAGSPPVYLSYPTSPALGQEQEDPTHTSNFGVKLQEKCNRLSVPCEVAYPGAPDVRHATEKDYLIAVLKAPTARAGAAQTSLGGAQRLTTSPLTGWGCQGGT
jgi:acetyl esterase/lipase